jgi:membrane associated rhomboid family serine protease
MIKKSFMRLSLRLLIFSTVGTNLVASLIPQVAHALSLSRSGIMNLYIWQLLTYPFVEQGFFSLGLLVECAFNMYLLWLFGSFLLERYEEKKFFTLYFGATLTGAIATIAVTPMSLSGSMGPVYAIMTAWMMINKEAKLLLFFSFPFKASLLILSLIAISIGADLVTRDWAEATSLITSVLFGYLFAIFIFKQTGPLSFLHPFERKIAGLFQKKAAKGGFSSKIYDIHSGNPILNDEQFMDAMLEKISKQGEKSLTEAEKLRMEQISKRRKNR